MNDNDKTAGDDVRRVLDRLQSYRVAENEMLTRARRSLLMSENELAALRFLTQQPGRAARPQALIRHLGISSASVTTLIDKLERAGRVERRLVAGDRRAVAVAITELAEREVRDTIGVTDERLEAAAQRLTPSELRRVEAFLRAVTDAVGGSAAA